MCGCICDTRRHIPHSCAVMEIITTPHISRIYIQTITFHIHQPSYPHEDIHVYDACICLPLLTLYINSCTPPPSPSPLWFVQHLLGFYCLFQIYGRAFIITTIYYHFLLFICTGGTWKRITSIRAGLGGGILVLSRNFSRSNEVYSFLGLPKLSAVESVLFDSWWPFPSIYSCYTLALDSLGRRARGDGV